MFKPYRILLDSDDMSIEVIWDRIEIKTASNALCCKPGDIVKGPKDMTFDDMVEKLSGKVVSEVIRKWYRETIGE